MTKRIPTVCLNFQKKGRYPGFLSELAESFGMMMVKVEAREFRLKEIIQQLEQAKSDGHEAPG